MASGGVAWNLLDESTVPGDGFTTTRRTVEQLTTRWAAAAAKPRADQIHEQHRDVAFLTAQPGAAPRPAGPRPPTQRPNKSRKSLPLGQLVADYARSRLVAGPVRWRRESACVVAAAHLA